MDPAVHEPACCITVQKPQTEERQEKNQYMTERNVTR
jgi:hypothetical protein